MCGCLQGRRLLRQWFLRPVVQLDVISDRHDTLDLLVAAPTTNDALRAAMKKVRPASSAGVLLDAQHSTLLLWLWRRATCVRQRVEPRLKGVGF